MENKKPFQGEIEKIAGKITNYGHIIEPALGLPALLLFVLVRSNLIDGFNLLFLFSITLSTYYFLEAYSSSGEVGGMQIFLTKVTGLGSSIATVGLLFYAGKIPGATEMMLAGALSLVFTMILFIITGLKSATKNPRKTRRIIRILLLIALMAWVIAKDGVTFF